MPGLFPPTESRPAQKSPNLTSTVLLVLATALSAGCDAPEMRPQPWLQYAAPEEAGFSSTDLEEARTLAEKGGSGAVMAVSHGRVLLAWGDVGRNLELHSVRKSLVSALYGIAVGQGRIDLDATLEELEIDDEPSPLTAAEKNARIRDIIAARSGIYLPSAYASSDQDAERPARGSHPPGTHWFYNNWDFNAAGVIYERLAGTSIYEAFAEQIARPLGMEDWSPREGFPVYEPSRSSHPALTFRMSARDLSRFGQLYLQEGKWNGAQIIPESWVLESTKPISETGPGRGYGFMWWTYRAGSFGPQYGDLDNYDCFAGSGTGGQLVAVIPTLEMVIVHRGDTDNNHPIGGRQVWDIVSRIVAARTGDAAENPRLVPLAPIPFATQLPAAAPPDFIKLTPDAMEEYAGDYSFGGKDLIRVFSWLGRTFMSIPGEGEAELFSLGEDAFTIRVLPGVRIAFGRDAGGKVAGAVIRMGNREIRAVKTKTENIFKSP
ncbi:MAG: serine hydrolase [Candidatus Aminicenantes bacterium]|nr:serine hydrolase [Candidatus Aminicenantes bacterium]